MFIHNGDYYPRVQIEKVIENAKLTPKTRKKMLELVSAVSKCKGMNGGIEKMRKNGYSQRMIDSLLDKFEEIDGHPYPIPRRWGVKYLGNIGILLCEVIQAIPEKQLILYELRLF